MSWKKHFQSSTSLKKYQSVAARYSEDALSAVSPNSYSSRFASWLPEVYSGQPNRIERYSQYDNMDLDTEINMALDTIADSSTQKDPHTNLPFDFEWTDNITEEETTLLKELLRQWVAINQFDIRIWKLFRSTLKYGDIFFIRDPQTYKLFWVPADKVDSVIVDEAKGKEPEQYVIRDLDANLQTLVATGNLKRPADQRGYSSGPLSSGQFGGGATYGVGGGQTGTRFGKGHSSGGYGGQQGLAYHVDASNVIHVSLSEGLDNVWPFGISILENIFKTFKQKELIEDSVIIYRVQRAPERRVFYVDTGRMPQHRAMAYLERIKNEIQQKRIPSRTGGQQNILDATYNPQCISLNTKIPLLDGRTLTLDDIITEYEQGKENWVYSCDPETGENSEDFIGKISWAGITRKNTQVMKLTFESGSELICTLDHKLVVFNKGFVEAKDVTPDDIIVSRLGHDRLVAKIVLKDNFDTGCINVENEYHTFSIQGGIFIKNSMLEDFYFAVNSDGKGSRVETLPGGDQLGQIDDLRYFHHKLRTGLRVPRSYMPDFDDGGGAIFNDGRVGTAYIEELRFTNYCERMQAQVIPSLDLEFKMFCKHRGANVHASAYKLKFMEPQNFSKYRQTEVDGSILNVLGTAMDITALSRRFALKRFGGLSEDEILENERLWAEENSDKLNGLKSGDVVTTGDESTGFGDVGATASGLTVDEGGTQPPDDAEDLDMDVDEPGQESPISGAEAQDRRGQESPEEL